MLAASLAISPRIQGPSQESTGIFLLMIFCSAHLSPAGQTPFIPSTSREKAFVTVFIISSLYLLTWISHCREAGVPIIETRERKKTIHLGFELMHSGPMWPTDFITRQAS